MCELQRALFEQQPLRQAWLSGDISFQGLMTSTASPHGGDLSQVNTRKLTRLALTGNPGSFLEEGHFHQASKGKGIPGNRAAISHKTFLKYISTYKP